MLEIFKQWVVSILCVAVVSTFIKMMLPESRLKKYINSLIGVLILLTIISPLVKLYSGNSLEDSISEVLSVFSSNDQNSKTTEENRSLQQEMVKKEFIESVRNDLKNKLEKINITVKEIVIQIDKDYNIQNIEIGIKKTTEDGISQVNKIVEYVNSEYDIDYSKITVIESGE